MGRAKSTNHTSHIMSALKPGLCVKRVLDGRPIKFIIQNGHELQINAINPCDTEDIDDGVLLVAGEEGNYHTLYSPFGVFSGPLVIVGPDTLKLKSRGSDFDVAGSVVVVDSFEGVIRDDEEVEGGECDGEEVLQMERGREIGGGGDDDNDDEVDYEEEARKAEEERKRKKKERKDEAKR